MADRADFLGRILRVLECERVDGVMATMDVLEELLIVAGLRAAAGQPDPLAGKLLIASLNRGGLAGVAWEMDDPMTGPSPEACAAWKLDGAKILLRLCDSDPLRCTPWRRLPKRCAKPSAQACPCSSSRYRSSEPTRASAW
ncbi:MAG: hypothetical protein R2748_13320 [Bryobacterales bacterium]